jgi:choline dehydrogenase-like flavoprotein
VRDCLFNYRRAEARLKHLRGAATYRSARRWDGPAVQAGCNLVQAARSAVKRRLNGTDGAPSRLPGQLHASLVAAASPALLDPKAKDKFGMPVASVHFDDHPNDIAMRDHAYKRGAAVYEAVGATVTYPTPPYPSTHNLGTNRMSEKPRDGVVNKFGQTHDVKNLFISDGSKIGGATVR